MSIDIEGTSTRDPKSVVETPQKAPLLKTLALVIPLILAAVILRPEGDSTGLPKDVFWTEKLSWRGCADMVLCGDSRVYRCASPAVMNEVLPGVRIRNFGFSSNGYSERYLDAILKVLDPESSVRAMILGVTPLSLTRGATLDNNFLWYSDRSLIEKLETRYLGRILHHLEPIDQDTLPGAFRRRRPQRRRLLLENHIDGWMATQSTPEDPTIALKKYQNMFDDDKLGPVSQNVINDLIESVENWRKEGIAVLACRPPSSRKMVELEDEKAKFDESQFIARFERAGGTWLRFAPDGYHSYDGSHLRRDAAVEFSRDLAAKTRETMLWD